MTENDRAMQRRTKPLVWAWRAMRGFNLIARAMASNADCLTAYPVAMYTRLRLGYSALAINRRFTTLKFSNRQAAVRPSPFASLPAAPSCRDFRTVP